VGLDARVAEVGLEIRVADVGREVPAVEGLEGRVTAELGRDKREAPAEVGREA
jgi:hypothetical protein